MKEYLRQFKENGFFVVRGILNDLSIRNLLGIIENVRLKVNQEPQKFETRYTRLDEDGFDTWGVSDLFCPELYEEGLSEYVFNEEVISILKYILGENLRYWGTNVLWNPSNTDYYLPWHRDGGNQNIYVNNDQFTHIQFNMALSHDLSFRAIPGSHKRPLTETEFSQVRNLKKDPLPGEVRIHLEPGDVLFTNAWLLHLGECKTTQFRRTIHVNVQPAYEKYGGNATKEWMKDQDHISRMSPFAQEIIRNLVEWDKVNKPVPLSSTARKHIYVLSRPMREFEKYKM